MVLLWLVMMMMVLVRSEAEEMKVKGEPGEDVTLTCSFKVSDTYWFMEVHNNIRAGLGRTFSTVSYYFSPDFEGKYLIRDHSLVIQNLTAEDFRLYFCGRRTNGTIVFKDTIQVFSGQTVTPSTQTLLQEVPDCGALKSTVTVYRSALLASVSVSLMAALIFTCWKKKRVQVDRPEPSRTGRTLQTGEEEDFIKSTAVDSVGLEEAHQT